MKKTLRMLSLAFAMVFLAPTADAQSSIVVRRNGKTYIKVTHIKPIQRVKRETPRRLRRSRATFRYYRHVNRFYRQRGHASHRCSYCLAYQRWLHRGYRRFNPIIRRVERVRKIRARKIRRN